MELGVVFDNGGFTIAGLYLSVFIDGEIISAFCPVRIAQRQPDSPFIGPFELDPIL